MLQRFEKSPLGVKLKAELDAEVVSERQSLMEQLNTLSTERLQKLPEGDALVAAATEKEKKAKRLFDEAAEALRLAIYQRAATSAGFDQSENRIKARLLELAPPEIRDFVSW